MDKYILHYGIIIMFIIIIFLVINLKKCLRNNENFASSPVDLLSISNDINKIYNMDRESIHNLSEISKSLIIGRNTFEPQSNGIPGTLTIPADNTILKKDLQVLGDTQVMGNIEIMGQTKIGTTIIDKDGNIKAGTTTISADGNITAGGTNISPDGIITINEGKTAILPNGDININEGKTTILANGDIIAGTTTENDKIITGTSILANGDIRLKTNAFLTSPDTKAGIRIFNGMLVNNFKQNNKPGWTSEKTILRGKPIWWDTFGQFRTADSKNNPIIYDIRD